MNKYSINSIEELHKMFRAFRSHYPTGWWFRGQSDVAWDLLPKAGRKEYFLPDNRDLGRFKAWRDMAIAYSKDLPDNDWECLAIAQHHGLATRLLDWTYNPLVAVYFAVKENFNKNGAVYCYDPSVFIQETKFDLYQKDVISVFGYNPRSVSPRILNQGGIFTVHCPANTEIIIEKHVAWENHSNLAEITIAKEIKKEVLMHLDDYGINEVSLFPGLDALSIYQNWLTLDMVEAKKNKKL